MFSQILTLTVNVPDGLMKKNNLRWLRFLRRVKKPLLRFYYAFGAFIRVKKQIVRCFILSFVLNRRFNDKVTSRRSVIFYLLFLYFCLFYFIFKCNQNCWSVLCVCVRSEENTPLDLDDHGGRTFLRVLLHLTMHDYPPLVSRALHLLFRHFSQRQEVLQAFKQVNWAKTNRPSRNKSSLESSSSKAFFVIFFFFTPLPGPAARHKPRCWKLQANQVGLGPTALNRGEVRAVGVQEARLWRRHGRRRDALSWTWAQTGTVYCLAL